MAEHSAVNRRVVGSSPTWGATDAPSSNVWCVVLFAFSQSIFFAALYEAAVLIFVIVPIIPTIKRRKDVLLRILGPLIR